MDGKIDTIRLPRMEEPREDEPCCCLVINGIQLIRCPMPTLERKQTYITHLADRYLMQTTPCYDQKTGRQLNPLYLNFLYVRSHVDPNCNYPVYCRAFLDKEQYNLGRLRYADKPGFFNSITAHYPDRITFEVTLLTEPEAPPPPPPPPRSPEQKFVDEIHKCIKNDKYKGSLPSTYVQSLVSHSIHYGVLTEPPHNGKWHDFLNAHKDLFHVFKYTAQDIQRNGMTNTCHANEYRVGLQVNRETMLEEDMRRERIRTAAEKEVFDFLYNLLATHGVCDAQFLMKSLEDGCPAYTREFLHPSYAVLERIVRMNENILWTVREEGPRGLVITPLRSPDQ
jgi:hypothetical protein